MPGGTAAASKQGFVRPSGGPGESEGRREGADRRPGTLARAPRRAVVRASKSYCFRASFCRAARALNVAVQPSRAADVSLEAGPSTQVAPPGGSESERAAGRRGAWSTAQVTAPVPYCSRFFFVSAVFNSLGRTRCAIRNFYLVEFATGSRSLSPRARRCEPPPVSVATTCALRRARTPCRQPQRQ